MWNLLVVLALAVAAPADVTATKLDGSTVTGKLASWSANGVALATAGGPVSIASADLLAVQFSTAPAADTGKPLLELVDGSALPLADFAAADKQLTARLQRPSPAEPLSISVPIEQVRAVRLQPLAAEVLPQWQEIRRLELPSDLVIISKRGGKSLDHLECVLGKVTATDVTFELDGKEVTVPRTKVAGLIYYRSDAAPAEAPPSVVVGLDGLRIAARDIQWQDDTLRTTMAGGLRIEWPLAGVASVDLSAGKVAFLSDLSPALKSWHPLVGLPKAASHIQDYGQPRFNQSASGGPLTLAYHPGNASTAESETRTFAKGIALRSRSELVLRLPRGYSRLLAEAGIEPEDASTGNVILSIYGDDQLLVEQAITGSDAPLPLDLDVADVKRLKIVVDFGQNLDAGDWLNLCNARVVK